MERTTQFNLMSEVATWRSELSNTDCLNKDDLDELESHLLDQVEALHQPPLSEREAFLVAKDRIGSKHDLKVSYKKSKSLWALFKLRSGLYLQAFLLIMLIRSTIQIVGFISSFTFDYYVLEHKVLPYLYTGILLTTFTLLFFYLRYLYRIASKPASRVSFTGYLTLSMVLLTLSIPFLANFMAQITRPQEYFYIVMFKNYLGIAGFLIALLFCIGYSIYEFKTARVKTIHA